MRVSVLAVLTIALIMGGCASIVSGQNQSVSVVTKSESSDVVGAKCSLSNDKGQWFATTPGSVTVRRSYAALAVDCKTDASAGTAQVKSSTKAMAFGNVLFGGVIGVGVDVATGAAYDYPDVISISLVGLEGSSPGSAPAVPALTSLAPAPGIAKPVALAVPVVLPAVPPSSVAPVSAPPAPAPAVPAKALAGGQDEFQARRLAQSVQCHANPAPILISKRPGSETYSVACSRGDTLAVKCELGTCQALK